MKALRQLITRSLWQTYRQKNHHMMLIEKKLAEKGITQLALDHFAIIDLPSQSSGIPHLQRLFTLLGYTKRGQGYLPDKQNDFVWMAEEDSKSSPAHSVLPQVVVADFRLDEMTASVRSIVEKYASQTQKAPIEQIESLLAQGSWEENSQQIHDMVINYLTGRDWPLPSVKEFHTVHEFNELLAWVLVFGRKPNHFTLSIHLLNYFKHLNEFHDLLTNDIQLELNLQGGAIKGGEHVGIAQGSTAPYMEKIQLADGSTELPTDFVEFVWRYPINTLDKNTSYSPWNTFFTGFIAAQANHVVESLCREKEIVEG